MKKRILTAITAAVGYIVYLQAQAPNLFSYQAVIRDGSGALVTNSSIGLELKIRQGSSTGNIV
ncbi:MAG: hypothetical protein FJY15_01605 [Bacteroidetes bacterium]|nr:hypothetical protein [Bacteroidota bacterium]